MSCFHPDASNHVLDSPCLLQWIDGVEAQGYAIVFIAKFFGCATKCPSSPLSSSCSA
jgi:hypothetical protein